MKINLSKYHNNSHTSLDPSIILWRYMSNEKFISLLLNKKLSLTRTDLLSDKYEVPIQETLTRFDKPKLSSQAIDKIGEEKGLNTNFYDPTVSQANAFSDLMSLKKRAYVNCWTKNKYESYALWKIYLNNERNGIAIRTSVNKLMQALIPKVEVNLEPVDYDAKNLTSVLHSANLSKDDEHRLIKTKMSYYDFEKEVRLFTINDDKSIPMNNENIVNKNVLIDIDITKLVDEVYISPFADDAYAAYVQHLLTSNGLTKKKVLYSKIRDR